MSVEQRTHAAMVGEELEDELFQLRERLSQKSDELMKLKMSQEKILEELKDDLEEMVLLQKQYRVAMGITTDIIEGGKK